MGYSGYCTPPPFPAWPFKDPADDLTFGLDFGSQMIVDTDTVASITSCTATPDGLTIRNTALVGNIVIFRAIGGTSGFQYTVTVVIETTSGNTYSRSALLNVISR
jgi:hypothetical protein